MKSFFLKTFNLLKWLVIPGSYQDMDPNDINERRKRKARYLAFGFFVLFVMMVVGWLLSQESGLEGPIGDDLAVALVLNLLIILLILLFLLVIRQLVKLYFDRRGAVAGSKFQTKLVVSFLAMTLAPSILMFLVATELLSMAVDRWYSKRVESTLSESLKVAESLYGDAKDKVNSNALYLSGLVKRRNLLAPQSANSLHLLLRQKIREYDVDLIQAYDHDFELTSEVVTPGGEPQFSIADNPDILAKVAMGESVTHVVDRAEGSIVAAITPILPDTDTERSKGAIVVIKLVSRDLIQRVHSISKAFEDYKQLTLKKEVLKGVYQVTLALVALVIVFSSIWVGFYLARGITIPLRVLSEATERVATGDLSVNIDVPARDDEVGQLVDAFNKMTHDLRVSEEDITRANEELSETNVELFHRGQYIETVLHNIVAGVISIDKSGLVTTINDSAARMLGANAKKARGSSYKKLLDKEMLAPIRQIYRDQTVKELKSIEKEVEITINGELRTLKASFSTLTDHMGAYLGTVMVFDDLTSLIAAQKTEAWKEMARIIAHEIKNPLTPIQLNVQRMRRKFEKNADDFPKVFDDATNTIVQEVVQLKLLVDKFSRLAKVGDSASEVSGDGVTKEATHVPRLFEPAPELAMLHDVIHEVIRLYRDTRPGVTLTTDLDPSVNLVNIDIEQIKRVFTNLVENSVESVGDKGVIDIATRRSKNKDSVIITVSDSGKGVPEDLKKKIFKPNFSTKKPHGAGLGLAIITRIVEDHGGGISVSNNVPHGACFTIVLPLG